MSATETPTEWRIADDEANNSLQVARAIERRQYPDGDAPLDLIPALVTAIALGRSARMMACD